MSLEKLISTGKSVPFFPKVVLPVMAWIAQERSTIGLRRICLQGWEVGPVGNRSGKARESELMLRVTAHGEDRMPSKGDALSDDQISLLRQWIKEGARYAKHWAYEKPVRPKVPSARNQSFIRNPIDSFVLQNLKGAGGHRANLRTRPVGCAESAWA